MASSPHRGAFDIRTVSACPIRLGRSAQQNTTSSGYTSIQYNHKPAISHPDRVSASIDSPETGSKLQSQSLKLVDGDERYLYKGGRSTGEHTYVLLPDEDGDGYILERLDSSFHFNLVKAPWEANANKLAKQYAQLSKGGDDEEGELFGDNAEEDLGLEEEADADNPFDFRHHMHTTNSPSPEAHPTKSSAIGTPSSVASQPSPRMSTPLARTARKPVSAFAPQEKKAKPKPKPKPAERSQASNKRSKPSPEPEMKQRQDVVIPEVRLDRRASTRIAAPTRKSDKHENDNTGELSLDMDDDGDLILEGDEPASNRNRRSLGLALSGALGGGGGGPRSLLSAASSPASHHNHSPHQPHGRSGLHERHVDTDGEEVEIDMGPESADDDDDDDQDNNRAYADADADADADAESDGELHMEDVGDDNDNDHNDNDDDVDVDEMYLPSPAQVHRPSVSSAVVTAADDDDYLENEMLLALEGGDDDVPSGGQQHLQQDAESEEESEEE